MNNEDNKAKSRAVDSLLNFETVLRYSHFMADKSKQLHTISSMEGNRRYDSDISHTRRHIQVCPGVSESSKMSEV